MVRVKNVKVTEIPFESKDANFQRCIKYIKSVCADYKAYIPKKPKHRLSFELIEANVGLANAIRRFLLDEIPVNSMCVIEEIIKTNDRHILSDYLKSRIEAIPISQEDDMSQYSISLDVQNKTDGIQSIRTRDLIIKNKSGKKMDNTNFFSNQHELISLRPMKFLKIPEITIETGVGKHNSSEFILLSNLKYEILDMEPIINNKYLSKGESSLVSEPHHFKIELTNHRNYSVKKIMQTCCDLMIQRFGAIKDELKNIKEAETTYFSDRIYLETKGTVKIFHLVGEYRTVANAISKYCYLLDKDIGFVAAGIIHPSTEESVVKISHTQSLKLMDDAIKKIISDVETVKKAF